MMSSRFTHHERREERGAALVELAVATLGILMLVALIIDGSLLFHRHTLLTETSATLVRKIASEVVREPAGGCVDLCTRAQNLIAGATNQPHLTGFTFEPTIIAANSGELGNYAPYPLIRIDGTAEARCLFCSLMPWEITLTARSLLVIESGTTGCDDSGTHTC
jgi:hypothetical protein